MQLLQPKIIFEDDDVVVIDKPAGLVVTPGPGYEEIDTLVGWLIGRYGEDLRSVGSGMHRPGIVHRLDKDTSGVMVCAKNQAAFLFLVDQFRKHRVKKQYIAAVWGDMGADERLKGSRSLLIDAPIGRNPRNRMRFVIRTDGKSACTKIKINKLLVLNGIKVTFVVAYPKTGRTHQIRVHLKSFGYGVVGDNIYQGRSEYGLRKRLTNEKGIIERLYLHAYRLRIRIPTGERMTFKSPLPSAFKTLFEK